jgi:glyceraldehyde 3-phosphate dehydrogenase
MRMIVAINGVGWIGRAILKLALDEPSIGLVAVNDLVDAENVAYDNEYGDVNQMLRAAVSVTASAKH